MSDDRSDSSIPESPERTKLIALLLLSVVGLFVNYGYQVFATRALTPELFAQLSVWLGRLAVLSAASVVLQRYLTVRGLSAKAFRMLQGSSLLICALAFWARASDAVLWVTVACNWLLAAWNGLSFRRNEAFRATLFSTVGFVSRLGFAWLLPLYFFEANSWSAAVVAALFLVSFSTVPQARAEEARSTPRQKTTLATWHTSLFAKSAVFALLQALLPFFDLLLIDDVRSGRVVEQTAWASLFVRIPSLLGAVILNVTAGWRSAEIPRTEQAHRLEKWASLGLFACAPVAALLVPWIGPFIARGSANASMVFAFSLNQAMLFLSLVLVHRDLLDVQRTDLRTLRSSGVLMFGLLVTYGTAQWHRLASDASAPWFLSLMHALTLFWVWRARVREQALVL